MDEKLEYLVKNIDKIVKQIKLGNIPHDIRFKRYYEENLEEFYKLVKQLIFANSIEIVLETDFESGMINAKKLSYNSYCPVCGKWPQFKIENNVLSSIDECVTLGDFTYDIDVPSGKLIFCDWPDKGRDILNSIEKGAGRIDINCDYGIEQMSTLYASHNIGTFFVGNSSPHILRKGNSIIVESPVVEYDDDDKEIGINYSDKTFEDVGSICTDLWWCTVFDLEVYQNIVGEKYDEDDVGAHTVVDVEPGKYRFKYDIDAHRKDYDEIMTYLRIDKI